jgi:hypothetical protein
VAGDGVSVIEVPHLGITISAHLRFFVLFVSGCPSFSVDSAKAILRI